MIFLTLATVSIAARLWVRLRILHRRLDWDDWFIIFGFVYSSDMCSNVTGIGAWRRDLSHEHFTPFDFYQRQYFHYRHPYRPAQGMSVFQVILIISLCGSNSLPSRVPAGQSSSVFWHFIRGCFTCNHPVFISV